ncbi:MAG: response regulator transcription factor [Planctomycetes bacterium]|nr:response regulator transcription factor [Planctomycetota bacterium]
MPKPTSRRRRVLLFEDEPRTNDALVKALKVHGIDVQRFADRARLVVAGERARPDAVLVDVSLPKVEGLALCRVLSSHPRLGTVPVILVSLRNLAHEDLVVEAVGATARVTKPYDLGLVLETFEQLFADAAR